MNYFCSNEYGSYNNHDYLDPIKGSFPFHENLLRLMGKVLEKKRELVYNEGPR